MSDYATGDIKAITCTGLRYNYLIINLLIIKNQLFKINNSLGLQN